MSCSVGHRQGSEPEFLGLWCILAAVALIQPLTWELLYATGAALKKKKKPKKSNGRVEETIGIRRASWEGGRKTPWSVGLLPNLFLVDGERAGKGEPPETQTSTSHWSLCLLTLHGEINP